MAEDEGEEKKDQELEYEATVSIDEALGHISSILHGLAHQKLTVASGETSIELRPSSVVQLEVEARDKDGEQKLEIELKWTKASSGKGLRIIVEDDEEECQAGGGNGGESEEEGEGGATDVGAAAGGEEEASAEA